MKENSALKELLISYIDEGLPAEEKALVTVLEWNKKNPGMQQDNKAMVYYSQIERTKKRLHGSYN